MPKYSREWRDEAEFRLREASWGLRRALGWLIGAGVLVVVFGVGLGTCGWFGEGLAVVRHEMGPKELLRKYEWFKEAAAALDAKRATVEIYAGRAKETLKAYGDKPRSEWPRDERESFRVWQQEVAGVKASYNRLASEWNAAMAKVNWRFCNVGDLPAGAKEVLPREYKEYVDQ